MPESTPLRSQARTAPPLTLKLDPYPVGHALDTLGPDRLVELGVEADVLGAHRLLGELNDRLHGMGGTLLEGAAVHALVQVDGVLAGDDVLEGGALALSCLFIVNICDVSVVRDECTFLVAAC